MTDLAFRPVVLEAAEGDCRLEAELGSLDVPVRHAQPDGPTWTLAVARLPALTDRPGAPIVLLAGGPGDSAVESLTWNDPGRQLALQAMRRLGDVIALDQRGTGGSWPVPAATERWDLPLDEPDDPARSLERAMVLCSRLRERWLDRGVDIGAFTTEESADDVDRLRVALGAERIRIVGSSYGSHLGFSVLRRHGPHVERALLGLVEGPDHTHKLPSRVQASVEHIGSLAAGAPELGGRIPAMVDELADLVDRLERAPMSVDQAGSQVVVGGNDLRAAVAGTLGSQTAIAGLPAALARLRAGDASWLAGVALEGRTRWLSNAMFWHMDAASGASPERRARILAEAPATILRNTINDPFPDIERAWGSPDLGDGFRSPVTSPVPVQFQSGSLDGRTPIANVDDVIGGFPSSGHLVVRGVAHDDGFEHPVARDAMLRFLAGEDPVDLVADQPFRFDPLP